MRPADLTPPERRVWRAFPKGRWVNFHQSDDEDPADGATWGPERTVRAEVLRALLLNGPAAGDGVPRLWLSGARIIGLLDLDDAAVEHSIG